MTAMGGLTGLGAGSTFRLRLAATARGRKGLLAVAGDFTAGFSSSLSLQQTIDVNPCISM